MVWTDLGCIFYGGLACNAAANLALMRKVRKVAQSSAEVLDKVAVLIPARNEAENLPRLLDSLNLAYPDLRIYVFDDESEDNTALIAKDRGAIVVSPRDPLPSGWTGKNRACHELAKAVIEDFAGEFILYLDADTGVHPGLLEGLLRAAEGRVRPVGVVTGMPRLMHGAFPEPFFLAWVPWILLSSNPFWLVDRTGLGHNYFTNGQVVLWRKSTYTEVWPHSTLRNAVLEDARIGRLLAKRRIPINVLNLTDVFETHMYKDWRECLDGLSKNSFEIMGNQPMTWLFALFLFAIAWGWVGLGNLRWFGLGFLLLSGLFSALGTRSPFYLGAFAPVTVSLGAVTTLRSSWWHFKKKVVWKGRNYSEPRA